jgi:NADH-quinone oxidoreductase subunit E
MTNANKTILLSPELRQHLDQWNLRYPTEHKRSGIFEALRCVQEENRGFLTVELMDAVADYLDLPKIAVYEVATFYSMYHLEPVGRHVIYVCTNISCSLNGAESILAHFKQRLGIELNGTTQDGKITLQEIECLGACIAPPVCQIGKKYYEGLTPEKVDKLIAALTRDEA